MNRARNAILLALMLFVAVQVSLNSAIESDALQVRDPIYSEKLALFQQHPEFWRAESDRPRLFAIGSSRTQMLVDPGALDPEYSAFNFGCSSCGPIAQLLYLRRLLAAGVRADIVLLEIHPAFLAELPKPFEMRWLQPHRLRAGEAEFLRTLDIETDAMTSGCQWIQTSSCYRSALLNEYAADLLPTTGANRRPTNDARGFVKSIEPGAALQAELRAKARIEYASAFADYRPGGPAVLALRRMVELCRQQGMNPMPFITPESGDFRSWYGDSGNTRFAEFCPSLGVPILDFRESLPEDDFADGHHPTPHGAATFTDALRRRLKVTP